MYLGDLANGNVKKANEREHQMAIEAQANDPNFMNDVDQVDNLCAVPEILQLTNVRKAERNKFFGSLPNHLDSDETYRENGNLFLLLLSSVIFVIKLIGS